MKRLLSLLTVLLAVQAVLIIYSYSGSRQETGAGELLVPLDTASVDHITVVGDDEKQVILEKRKGNWILPDHYEVIADSSRVNELLGKIAALKAGWPVATTASAALRFHVADDRFKRKLVLREKEKKTILYLGDSAGVRSAYLRREGSSDVFRGNLASYDFPTDPDKWLNPALLKLDEKEIVELKINDLTLVRENDDFFLKDAGERKTKKSVAKNMVTALTDLKVDGVLGRKEDPAYKLDKPVLDVVVKNKDGSTVEYRFARDEKTDNNYVLKCSSRNEYFRIALWRINTLLDTKRADLLEKESAKEVKEDKE
jgi:hypothetical protein